MEIYVDDMLVKSKKAETHVSDLEKTFRTLRKYGLKLNSVKCSFGVRSGKFIGYMVTEMGIEVNLEKVAAMKISPPRKDSPSLKYCGQGLVLLGPRRYMQRLTN